MSTILQIETSTEVCSAALAENNTILIDKTCFEQKNHAVQLPIFIAELIDFARLHNKTISAVAISAGPGSYTGLRIGVSSAKGICYALNIPLVAIDTLKLIAVEAQKTILDQTLFVPMIDARRMEVYTSIYNHKLERMSKIEPKILDESSFADILKTNKIVFCGNGSNKFKNIINNKNAIFVDNIAPLAVNMTAEAYHKCNNQIFENTAYFEPLYLKEFYTTKH